MTPDNDNARVILPGELPEALSDNGRRLSLVWLIPLVALVSAAWLGYRTLVEQGPLITITFPSAEGIEATKTRVRFKDVDIGMVEQIDLSDDLTQVLVRARLDRSMAPFLNDSARFWVVRPRLSGGQITGLATLVGGSYIAADLTSGSTRRDSFAGLDAPPVVTVAAAGKGFTLLAPSLDSLGEGSPLLHQGVEVGRVVGYQLRDDGQVAIRVFVDAPYDASIRDTTRFWNVSGVGMTVGADGVKLETASLAAMLRGGIAFANPDGDSAAGSAEAGREFELFANRQAAWIERFHRGELWQLVFHGSVRGLEVGAPVEFRGIPIGEVTDIGLRVDIEDASAAIPVTVAIEAGRLGVPGLDADPGAGRQAWDALAAKGLRAQLKTDSLITGALYVNLDFHPGEAAGTIAWNEPMPLLPTALSPLDELSVLLNKLARMPVDDMVRDLADSLASLRDTMDATNRLLARLDNETTSELNATLVQTRSTLAALEKTLSTNSPLTSEAHRVLRELGQAARSLRIMADYLERHPEALLRGKDGG